MKEVTIVLVAVLNFLNKFISFLIFFENIKKKIHNSFSDLNEFSNGKNIILNITVLYYISNLKI